MQFLLLILFLLLSFIISGCKDLPENVSIIQPEWRGENGLDAEGYDKFGCKDGKDRNGFPCELIQELMRREFSKADLDKLDRNDLGQRSKCLEEKKALNKSLKSLTDEKDSLQAQLQSVLEQKRNNEKSAAEELNQLKNTIAQKQDALNELKQHRGADATQVRELQDQLTALQAHLYALGAERDDALARLSNTEREGLLALRKYENVLAEAEHEYSRLKAAGNRVARERENALTMFRTEQERLRNEREARADDGRRHQNERDNDARKISEMNNLLQQKNDELQKFKNAHSDLLALNKTQGDKITYLEKVVNDQTNKLTASERQLELQAQEIANRWTRIWDLEREVSSVKDQNNELLAEHKTLKDENAKLATVAQQQAQQINILTTEKGQLEKHGNDLANLNEQQKQLLEQNAQQIAKLGAQNKVQEQQLVDLTTLTQQQKQQLDSLNEQKGNLEAQRDTLAKQNEQQKQVLEQNTHQMAKLEADSRQLDVQNKAQQQQLAELNETNQNLTNQLAQKQKALADEIQRSREREQELGTKVTQAETRASEQGQRSAELLAANQKLTDELKKLEKERDEEIKKLNKQLEKSTKDSQGLEAKLAALGTAHKEQLEDLNQRHSDQLAALETQNIQLNDKNLTLAQDLKDAENKLAEKKKKIQTQKELLAAMKVAAETRENKLVELDNQLLKSEEEKNRLLATNEPLVKELEEKSTELSQKQEELSQVNQRLNDLEQRIAQQQDALSEKDELQNKLTEATRKLDELNPQLDKLSELKELIDNQIKELEQKDTEHIERLAQLESEKKLNADEAARLEKLVQKALKVATRRGKMSRPDFEAFFNRIYYANVGIEGDAPERRDVKEQDLIWIITGMKKLLVESEVIVKAR